MRSALHRLAVACLSPAVLLMSLVASAGPVCVHGAPDAAVAEADQHPAHSHGAADADDENSPTPQPCPEGAGTAGCAVHAGLPAGATHSTMTPLVAWMCDVAPATFTPSSRSGSIFHPPRA